MDRAGSPERAGARRRFAVGAVVATVAVTIWLAGAELSRARAAGVREADRTASAAVDRISSAFDEGIAAIDRAAVGALVGRADCDPNRGPASPFPSTNRHVLDRSGDVRCSTLDGDLVRVSTYRYQRWLTSARASAMPVRSAVFTDPFTREHAVAIATAIRDDGAVVGFLADVTPLSEMASTVRDDIGADSSTAIVVLDRTERDVVASTIERATPITPLPEVESAGVQRWLDRVDRLWGADDVGDLSWRVYAGLSEATALAPTWSWIRRLVLLMILAAATARLFWIAKRSVEVSPVESVAPVHEAPPAEPSVDEPPVAEALSGGLPPAEPAAPAAPVSDLEVAFRYAIDAGTLGVEVRAVLDLTSRAWIGAEAVPAWSRDGAPVDVVELARACDLEVALDDHVLARAIVHASAWRDQMRAVPVSVAVSPAWLADASNAQRLTIAIIEAGLAPRLLVVDLPAGALDHGGEAIDRLREAGIATSIDGADVLRLAPRELGRIERVRLPARVVSSLGFDPAGAEVAAAIARLASVLHATVFAEGLQTETQVAEVQRLGCQAGSGPLFAAPEGDAAAIWQASAPCGWS